MVFQCNVRCMLMNFPLPFLILLFSQPKSKFRDRKSVFLSAVLATETEHISVLGLIKEEQGEDTGMRWEGGTNPFKSAICLQWQWNNSIGTFSREKRYFFYGCTASKCKKQSSLICRFSALRWKRLKSFHQIKLRWEKKSLPTYL